MRGKKQLRTVSSDLTAGTSDETFQSESGVASDLAIASYDPQTSVQRPVVGRTPTDLLYDTTLSGACGKFISGLNPVEVLATTAYVLLGVWGKSNGLPIPFWEFITLFAAYHIVLRPTSEWLFRTARGTPEPPQKHPKLSG